MSIILMQKINTKRLFKEIRIYNLKTKNIICEYNSTKRMSLYNMLNEKYIYTHDAYVTYNSGLLIIDLTKRRKSRVVCRIILSDKSGEIHLNCIEYYLKENEKILNTFEKSL